MLENYLNRETGQFHLISGRNSAIGRLPIERSGRLVVTKPLGQRRTASVEFLRRVAVRNGASDGQKSKGMTVLALVTKALHVDPSGEGEASKRREDSLARSDAAADRVGGGESGGGGQNGRDRRKEDAAEK